MNTRVTPCIACDIEDHCDGADCNTLKDFVRAIAADNVAKEPALIDMAHELGYSSAEVLKCISEHPLV